MDLQIKNHLFVVGGATKGLGYAIAKQIIDEGGRVIAIARTQKSIEALEAKFPNQIEGIVGSLTDFETHEKIITQIGNRQLHGMVVNSGGPPVKSFLETNMEEWDEAYQTVVRWKIHLVKKLLPNFQKHQYGKILFVESITVKEPVPNLVLSNSMRMAIIGMAKTLSQEVGKDGITINTLAPGYHLTQRLMNIFEKRSQVANTSVEAVKKQFEQQTAVKKIGKPEHFAKQAILLLSPLSAYITGQVITIDGGVMKGVF
jgi:3-oxoacyl-[acyl-carrier protein] reductase